MQRWMQSAAGRNHPPAESGLGDRVASVQNAHRACPSPHFARIRPRCSRSNDWAPAFPRNWKSNSLIRRDLAMPLPSNPARLPPAAPTARCAASRTWVASVFTCLSHSHGSGAGHDNEVILCPPHSTLELEVRAAAPVRPHLDRPLDIRFALIILAVLALGLFYMAYSIRSDISAAGGGPTTILPFILLGVAMLIALGFEFVNGFHDTANAVATVIYTHALPAQVAVVWSGCWNLLGVLASTGAVAFGIVSLLPVELILQVGSARRLRDGVRAAHLGDHLEPWHLVVRHSRLEFAHPDRLDRRRRRRQRAHSRPERHRRRRLGPGHQGRRSAPVLAPVRLRPVGAAAPGDEGRHPRAGALQGPDHQQAAVALDPRALDPHLHAGLVLPWLERRPEGHGSHHADPDRRRADGLCAEPRAVRRSRRPVRFRRARRFEDRRSPRRRIQCHRRSPPGGDGIHSFAHDLGRHLSVARGR